MDLSPQHDRYYYLPTIAVVGAANAISRFVIVSDGRWRE